MIDFQTPAAAVAPHMLGAIANCIGLPLTTVLFPTQETPTKPSVYPQNQQSLWSVVVPVFPREFGISLIPVLPAVPLSTTARRSPSISSVTRGSSWLGTIDGP